MLKEVLSKKGIKENKKVDRDISAAIGLECSPTRSHREALRALDRCLEMLNE